MTKIRIKDRKREMVRERERDRTRKKTATRHLPKSTFSFVGPLNEEMLLCAFDVIARQAEL